MKALLAIILLMPAIVWAETINVPKDHFLGISPPCVSVADAREKALHDVASQILRTIGASYSVSFTSKATGTTEKVHRTIDERFHYSASGFLAEIETRIVSQEFERGSMGVVYRMLVHFPKQLISRMRRLSRGSKVLATRLGETLPMKSVRSTVSLVCSLKRHMSYLSEIAMPVS